VRYANGTSKILYPAGYQAGDRFGAASVAVDFNQDRCTDLLVGAPAESVGSVAGAGAVIKRSLTDDGPQWALITQDSPNMLGTAEAYDHFGAALAAKSGDQFGAALASLRRYQGSNSWNESALW
jgi:FG-GAP repeat